MAYAKDIMDLCLYRWRSYTCVSGGRRGKCARVCAYVLIRKWAKGESVAGG